jgi:agmatinase
MRAISKLSSKIKFKTPAGKCYIHQPVQTFSGPLSFMRLPYTKDLKGVDVAVSGVPFDNATTNRPGARFGPRGIREASTQLAELLPYPWGFDINEYMKTVDYGDCWLDVWDPKTIKNTITEHAKEIIKHDTKMLTFGGDHYITYPLLIAHVEKYGKPLSLIHFDAHTDTWQDGGVPDEQMNHGTMFYKAVKEGLIDPEKSIQIGIRTFNQDTLGFNIYGADWIHDNGTDKLISKIYEIIGQNEAYLTFDIDCLDPAYAPGTGTPVCGGLTTHQALKIIRSLTRVNIVGMDVVEVAPAYDQSEITSLAAAHIACDLLCVLAHQKKMEFHAFHPLGYASF